MSAAVPIRLIGSVLLVVVTVSCGLLSAPGPIEKSLSAASPGDTVSTDGWCGSSWSRVLVIPPYQDPREVEAALGDTWSGYADTGQAMRDDVVLFTCVSGEQVLTWEAVPRTVADLDTNRILTIEKGVTGVRIEVRDGRRFLSTTP
jgi:hypothetical protein